MRVLAADPALVAHAGVIDLTAPGAVARAESLDGEWGFANGTNSESCTFSFTGSSSVSPSCS